VKKTVIMVLVLAFALAGCSSKKQAAAKLVAGTSAYQLAQDLMKILPALDPAKSAVVVSSKTFDVTTADVVLLFQESMGNRTDQLKSLDAQRLKTVIEQAAVQFGERRLLLEAAVAAKAVPTPEEIKSALDSQYAQAGGEAQFEEMIKTNGIGLENVTKSIREDVTIQKYLRGILDNSVKVTDAEIQKSYQEDKTASVRHILMLTQGKTPAEKADIRKKMDEILARANKGEDFAGLAKEYSEDPGSKENGGLYEDFTRGKMVKAFEDAAFSVPVGQISPIVETNYGFHIIKVENRKKETEPLDQAKTRLEAQIKEQKQLSVFESHMAKLKEKAKFQSIGLKS